MSHAKLAEIVLDFIEFLELADDEHLDPDTAVGQHESIAARLAEATPQERAAVQQAAKARLNALLREPVRREHRALWERIVSGEAYGWPPDDAT